jgi:TonB family protein
VRFITSSLLMMLTACASGCAQNNASDGATARNGAPASPTTLNTGNCPAAPDPATVKIDPLPLIHSPSPDGQTTKAKPIKIVHPLFTECAIYRGVSGIVDFAFTVEPDGSVGDVKIIQEVPAGFGFAQAAEAVIPQWQFQPRLIDGKPVAFPASYRITMRYVELDPAAQDKAPTGH